MLNTDKSLDILPNNDPYQHVVTGDNIICLNKSMFLSCTGLEISKNTFFAR